LKYFEPFVEHKTGCILVFGFEKFEPVLAPKAGIIEAQGDYDSHWKPALNVGPINFDAIYCFEVLEHLLNPLQFLQSIKRYMNNTTPLYISFPTGRPQFLWTKGHFHEYSKNRADKMFELAGLKIINSKITPPVWMRLYKHFTGIKPFLRLFFPKRWAIYKLRKETE